MHVVLDRADGYVRLRELDEHGGITGERLATDTEHELAAAVRALEARRPRWVWDDTSRWYPALLAAGARIERCVDLRLCHAILRASASTARSQLAQEPPSAWDEPTPDPLARQSALFDLDEPELDVLAEWRRQRAAVDDSAAPGRLRLLLAAESAGALAAAEMRHTGLPWRTDVHLALLERQLGPRPASGDRPERMRELLNTVRDLLGVPDLNADSAPELLKALTRAGVAVDSTRSFELRRVDHPVIAPLLEYKKLARLFAANGWHWLDDNVRDGRFRPEYVPGGVVTGRWSSKGGGGALQLPRQIREAVVADPGWTLVVADAAQLEPRILAGMAADHGMLAAASGADLYSGIVESGAVDTRDHAKVAMLGAMYGATSGEAGRLMPRLARAYPRAIALVEDAARAGERGEVVSTLLGRSSPPGVAVGYDETADQGRVRDRAKAWGRFTRNFVVQGTAAEWALCWMAMVRARLHSLGGATDIRSAPHLVFFVHDELVVHTPAALAPRVEVAVRAAAQEAGRLLFPELRVEFPLSVVTADDYGLVK